MSEPPSGTDAAQPDGLGLTWALVAVGVVAVSFSAPIAATSAAPALAVAFWRNAMAGVVVLPWTALRRRAEIAHLLRAERRTALIAVAAGLVLALHFGLWIPSLRLTSITASTALVTTTPLWTILLERLQGVRPGSGVLVGVMVSLSGVLVITGVDATASREALLGDALAVAGGAAAAGYAVLGAKVRRTTSTTSYTAIAYSVCALVLLPVCLLSGQQLGGYSLRTWLGLAALTFTAQLLGHSLLNRVLRVLGPTPVAQAILLEVPGAALLAWLFWHQQPPAATVPGAVLVLLGLGLVLRARRRQRWSPRRDGGG